MENRARNRSADVSMPDNNTAERAMKPVALGRKNWMFAGSQRGGKAMAIAFTLIETAITGRDVTTVLDPVKEPLDAQRMPGTSPQRNNLKNTACARRILIACATEMG